MTATHPLLASLVLLAVVAAGGGAPADAQYAEPEAQTGTRTKALVHAERHMVVAADPLAAEAGRLILRKGGTAIDAAIAAQLVLGLVEPQSSGLGGGGFLVAWDNAAKALKTYDGRETAPATARPDRFMREGKPMPFEDAVRSGLGVGVPGVVRLLETVHAKHGRLPWADLFAPAIDLAERGFPVSPRLSQLLAGYGVDKFAPDAGRYFFDDAGHARPAGFLLKNPAYAATLRAIATAGSYAFYKGPIAEAMVAAVRDATTIGGDMTAADLAAYRVEERTPVCFAYRKHQVCGVGPPSSGGTTVAATLMLLEPMDIGHGQDQAMSGQALHLIAEAEKLAYADRDRYVADPAFVSVPRGLTDPAYIAARRALIDSGNAAVAPPPGIPPGAERHAFGIDATHESRGTSHLSVVDDAGNAVAMTTSIEQAFGSRLMVAGFLLNNELTDFSFVPEDVSGKPVANRVDGGKRPRSSIAPTIVFGADHEVEAVLGSPGGNQIILYVVKALVALLDWEMNAAEAAALTNFGSSGKAFELETSAAAAGYALNLLPYKQSVSFAPMTSGLHIIVVRKGRLEGGADPRREGVALGD